MTRRSKSLIHSFSSSVEMLSEEVPMPMSRVLALSTAMFIATSFHTAVDAATLSLVGNSTTVCRDSPGTPTAAKTLSNFGLAGVDLGFPVDSGSGPLYFLFGDGAL